MGKGIEKPSFNELLKDLQSINEIKERVKTLDVIRLKELIVFIHLRLMELIKTVDLRLMANPKETFEYAAANTSTYFYNYYDLKYLKELIQNRINYLSVKQNNIFNDLVFKDAPSQRFFNYLVDNWLKNEVNKRTALSYIFTQMWVKSIDIDIEITYKIICTQPYFAREYWSLKHNNLLKLDIKKPRLKKDGFTDYYENRFKKHLNEFKEV